MRQRFSLARLLASTSLVAAVAMGLGGCTAMSKLSDVTGSIGGPRAEAPAADRAPTDPVRAVEVYGERYRANPKDADTALGYGQALRANGQRAQAVAVLEQATIANPGNKLLLAQYGRALSDNGNFQQAFDVLSKAHSPDNPDWRLLSVQGTCLDQMGRHDEARGYYASALKIAPGDPGVLSNLGLSYMLSRDLPKAEETLRQAYASPRASSRVRQNLGLVVGLQGRFAEAETIVKADLPPDQAAANVAFLKEMLNRNDGARGVSKRTPVASLSQGD